MIGKVTNCHHFGFLSNGNKSDPHSNRDLKFNLRQSLADFTSLFESHQGTENPSDVNQVSYFSQLTNLKVSTCAIEKIAISYSIWHSLRNAFRFKANVLRVSGAGGVLHSGYQTGWGCYPAKLAEAARAPAAAPKFIHVKHS